MVHNRWIGLSLFAAVLVLLLILNLLHGWVSDAGVILFSVLIVGLITWDSVLGYRAEREAKRLAAAPVIEDTVIEDEIR